MLPVIIQSPFQSFFQSHTRAPSNRFSNFGVVGVVCLVIFTYATVLRIDFLNRSSEVKAVVVDFQFDSDGGLLPVVQFLDPKSGNNVKAVTSMSINPPEVSMGQEVSVLYDPENLSAPVVMNNFHEIWSLSMLLFAAGTVFTVVAILGYVFEIKRNAKF